ncbi:hypothetical protein ABZ419_27270 [Streptomyces cinnamoneus]|uniref:hypothetical protein n=1 Tax=Streptomyces cinnamoneus TaxID=53446 RepID=UPI0033E6E70F
MSPTTTSNPAPTPTRTPVFVSHAEPLKRDLVYDHRAAQAALPVRVHFRDGTSAETVLVLTPGQVELFHLQVEQVIGKRRDALRKETEEREAAEMGRREGGDR